MFNSGTKFSRPLCIRKIATHFKSSGNGSRAWDLLGYSDSCPSVLRHCCFWKVNHATNETPDLRTHRPEIFVSLGLSQGNPTWEHFDVYSLSEQLHTNRRCYDIGHLNRIQRQEESMSMKIILILLSTQSKLFQDGNTFLGRTSERLGFISTFTAITQVIPKGCNVPRAHRPGFFSFATWHLRILWAVFASVSLRGKRAKPAVNNYHSVIAPA